VPTAIVAHLHTDTHTDTDRLPLKQHKHSDPTTHTSLYYHHILILTRYG